MVALMLLLRSWEDCGWREVSVSLSLSLIITLWVFFVGIGGGLDCLKTDSYNGFGKKLKFSVQVVVLGLLWFIIVSLSSIDENFHLTISVRKWNSCNIFLSGWLSLAQTSTFSSVLGWFKGISIGGCLFFLLFVSITSIIAWFMCMLIIRCSYMLERYGPIVGYKGLVDAVILNWTIRNITFINLSLQLDV